MPKEKDLQKGDNPVWMEERNDVLATEEATLPPQLNKDAPDHKDPPECHKDYSTKKHQTSFVEPSFKPQQGT